MESVCSVKSSFEWSSACLSFVASMFFCCMNEMKVSQLSDKLTRVCHDNDPWLSDEQSHIVSCTISNITFSFIAPHYRAWVSFLFRGVHVQTALLSLRLLGCLTMFSLIWFEQALLLTVWRHKHNHRNIFASLLPCSCSPCPQPLFIFFSLSLSRSTTVGWQVRHVAPGPGWGGED